MSGQIGLCPDIVSVHFCQVIEGIASIGHVFISVPPQELGRSLDIRVSSYYNLQQRIQERACLFFTHFLQQRGYEGKLRFSHNKQKLEIQVGPVYSD